MKTLHRHLNQALRDMRIDAELEQSELAAEIEMSRGSVSNYERAATVPPKWNVTQRWAKACGYDPDDPELRELWEEARRSGWIYEFTLLDMLGGETGDDATVIPLTLRPELPIPRQGPVRRQDAA